MRLVGSQQLLQVPVTLGRDLRRHPSDLRDRQTAQPGPLEVEGERDVGAGPSVEWLNREGGVRPDWSIDAAGGWVGSDSS